MIFLWTALAMLLGSGLTLLTMRWWKSASQTRSTLRRFRLLLRRQRQSNQTVRDTLTAQTETLKALVTTLERLDQNVGKFMLLIQQERKGSYRREAGMGYEQATWNETEREPERDLTLPLGPPTSLAAPTASGPPPPSRSAPPVP